MEKKYFYVDNWNGKIMNFSNLRDAKKSAKFSTGVSVLIYENKTNKVIRVACSGHILS